jgi:hypothetical protein
MTVIRSADEFRTVGCRLSGECVERGHRGCERFARGGELMWGRLAWSDILKTAEKMYAEVPEWACSAIVCHSKSVMRMVTDI